MAFPFDSERFTKYSLTSLETSYFPSLLLPLDLGITVDLICPEVYESSFSTEIDPNDAELLYEPIKPKTENKVLRDYTNTSGYLRKSTLPAGPTAYSNVIQAKEEPIELDVEKEFDNNILIPKINAAFEKKEFVHPTKPHLKVDKVYNVLPDEKQFCTEFVMFVYDEEPEETGCMNLLKEFADDEDTHLLSLYLKEENDEENEEYYEKDKKDDENQEISYNFLRNYKYNYLNDPNQNDILMWVDDTNLIVSYCIVENKMQLKKKPIPKSQNIVNLPDRKVAIKYRDEKKSELIIRKEKLVEYGFAPESGMETPVLNAMADDLYEENREVNSILNKLFGDDDSLSDE